MLARAHEGGNGIGAKELRIKGAEGKAGVAFPFAPLLL
jgi:hypothetical protein